MTTNNQQNEITLRAIILSCFLTVIFTAANAYLGLKVGLTFATSIPAAVISMAILRKLRKSNILENNIVQTITSSAGCLASVVFILPALVLTDTWSEFPFAQTFFLVAISGIFGVLYTIPLRRVLVVDSSLPFPEGCAAANILKAGDKNIDTNKISIKSLLLGSVISFIFSLFTDGFKVFSQTILYFGKISGVYTGLSLNLNFSLIGAGYLVGIRVCFAVLIGLIFSWLMAVPFLSAFNQQMFLNSNMSGYEFVMNIWQNNVRYIGTGVIGVASIWAIIILFKPLKDSLLKSFKNNHLYSSSIIQFNKNDQDIHIVWVIILCSLLVFPLLALFCYFVFTQLISFSPLITISMVVVCVFLAVILGFFVSAVSGYMAGIIGSSNSPIAGVGVLAIIIIGVALSFVVKGFIGDSFVTNKEFIVSLLIFTTSSIFSMACISNDNLQDLKTGYLVGATPWKQQICLILGVIIGALVLPSILNKLYMAYGFEGHLPRHNMDPSQVLSAPHANLFAILAKGIVGSTLKFKMFIIGAFIGLAFIVLNIILKNYKVKEISVFAIGFGIYLPPGVNTALILGGLLNYLVSRNITGTKRKRYSISYTSGYKNLSENHLDLYNTKNDFQSGVLFASGLIVGESVFGVLAAFIIVFSGKVNPLAIVSSNFIIFSKFLGLLFFIIILFFSYLYLNKVKRLENEKTHN